MPTTEKLVELARRRGDLGPARCSRCRSPSAPNAIAPTRCEALDGADGDRWDPENVTVVGTLATRRTTQTIQIPGAYAAANQAAMDAVEALGRVDVAERRRRLELGPHRRRPALPHPFDAASTEINTYEGNLPWTWSTFNLDAWGVNVNGGAGNVVLTAGAGTYGNGDTANTGGVMGSNVTDAVPAANVIKVHRLLTGAAAAPPGKMQHLVIQRVGGNGGDTYASDYFIRGLMLTKAS